MQLIIYEEDPIVWIEPIFLTGEFPLVCKYFGEKDSYFISSQHNLKATYSFIWN